MYPAPVTVTNQSQNPGVDYQKMQRFRMMSFGCMCFLMFGVFLLIAGASMSNFASRSSHFPGLRVVGIIMLSVGAFLILADIVLFIKLRQTKQELGSVSYFQRGPYISGAAPPGVAYPPTGNYPQPAGYGTQPYGAQPYGAQPYGPPPAGQPYGPGPGSQPYGPPPDGQPYGPGGQAAPYSAQYPPMGQNYSSPLAPGMDGSAPPPSYDSAVKH